MRWPAASQRRVALIVALALAGCAAPPSAPQLAPGGDDRGWPMGRTQAVGYEQRIRERALALGRQGRLADAALSWEVLTVLRPESADYRDRLSEMRRLVERALADNLQRAAQAARRNDPDAAAAQYLAALALRPDHAQAAEALRALERERNRRSYLGKPSRLTLTRRATTDAQMAGTAIAVPLDRNEVEHAALLGTQGEYDDAIGLLERHLAVDRRDAAACQLLADMYLRKGEVQVTRDKSGALAAFEQSARIDPSDAKAAAWVRQLRSNAQVSVLATAPASACSLR